MKQSLLALALGFLTDLLIGDPHFLYHPIRLVGNLIAFLEKRLNMEARYENGKKFSDCAEKERTVSASGAASRNRRNFLRGMLLAVLVTAFSTGVPLLFLWLAQRVHPYLRLVLETVFCWQLLATKSLKDESMKVYERLRAHDLAGSRKAVSMIVGRDTEKLDETGVTKAAVETVAENTSDGVVAPLFYMALGGAAFGFFYKAVNTMDSMIGYKNGRYLYFGRTAARLDDVLNFLPSRISALLMIAASALIGLDGKNAWRIFKRDRYRHASPNSAQTEAVMAGALDVQLAGDAWYFGRLYKKEFIGDPIRPVEPEDIVRANRLLYATAALAMLLLGAGKLLIAL